ncbi:MAG: gliding motility-associated ABC transporter substrate-binding protein GldG, partial [Bacteroidota bacterium]
LLDPVVASMDSLRIGQSSTTMAIPRENNLGDMLFTYGVRVNPNLVMDLRAFPIPIVTGQIGNQEKRDLFPWFYFPMLMPASNHPIVNNLDAVKAEFVSSIDLVGGKGIEKTVLLSSSDKSRVQSTPSRVSLNILREPPRTEQYNKPPQPVAVLLEGEFESVFRNRLPPNILQDQGINFKEKSQPTKVIVAADGDLIRNPVDPVRNKYFALGFDPITNHLYANKDFVMNAINYLCDDSGLIEVRSKEFKIRLLDQQRAATESLFWQLINTALPIALVILFGVGQFFVRKRLYAR